MTICAPICGKGVAQYEFHIVWECEKVQKELETQTLNDGGLREVALQQGKGIT